MREPVDFCFRRNDEWGRRGGWVAVKRLTRPTDSWLFLAVPAALVQPLQPLPAVACHDEVDKRTENRDNGDAGDH